LCPVIRFLYDEQRTKHLWFILTSYMPFIYSNRNFRKLCSLVQSLYSLTVARYSRNIKLFLKSNVHHHHNLTLPLATSIPSTTSQPGPLRSVLKLFSILYLVIPYDLYPRPKLYEGIKKFPDWPPGARTASGTALCH